MDYIVNANFTVFEGTFPNREAVHSGTIEFTMHGSVNIEGAERIAELEVARKEGYKFTDVCAEITSVRSVQPESTAIIEWQQEAAQIRQQEAMMRYAGITFASSVVAFFVIMLLIKWVGRSSEKKKEEDLSLAFIALRTRTEELERKVDKVSNRQDIMREQYAATHATIQP